MAKPFLTEISVFDATIGTRASFKIYTSSATVTQYEYTIYDGAETNVVCKVEEDANHLSYSATAGYSFLISPNNNLKNRAASYYMKLRVKLNTDTDYGDYSSAVNLYCKEKPVLTFAELSSEKNKFSMASVLFNLVYEANEDQEETIRTYQYHLYDQHKKLIDESVVYYGTISHTYSAYNLENGCDYFIRGTATTKNGYEIETSYIPFSIEYSTKKNDFMLSAINNRYDGTVSITSHFVSSDGTPDGSFSFIDLGDDNYVVDLSNGTSVTYRLPTEVSQVKDFDFKAVVKPILRTDLVTFTSVVDGIELRCSVMFAMRSFTDIDDTATKLWAIMKLYMDDEVIGVFESNYIDNSNEDVGYILLDVQHLDGYYDLNIKNLSDEEVAQCFLLGKTFLGMMPLA